MIKKLRRKLRHKSCAWKYNYPACDPTCEKDNAFVVSEWKNVNCKKCLKHRKKRHRHGSVRVVGANDPPKPHEARGRMRHTEVGLEQRGVNTSVISQRDKQIEKLTEALNRANGAEIMASQKVKELEAEVEKFKADAAHREMEVFSLRRKVRQRKYAEMAKRRIVNDCPMFNTKEINT